MAYTGINFNRARMPARQGIIDPSRMGRMAPQMAVPGGSMRQGIVSAPTMREALMQQSGPQQSVAEILSEPLGEMTPNLGAATSAASRQRQIADMLMQGAMAQDNTSIAGGLSQLGQAFLARRAGQKADTAEDKQREMASLLLQQAMQGGEQGKPALEQLLMQNPEYGMQYAMQANMPKQKRDPIVVNDQLVDPDTYQPLGDFRDPVQPEAPEYVYEQIGEEIVAIDKRDPMNRIPVGRAPVKSPLVDIRMPGQGPQVGTIPQGYGLVEDPTNPSGYRMEAIPGGPAGTEAQGAATARKSLENTFRTLFLNYSDLADKGAIRDSSKGIAENLSAYAQSTPLGREVGKIVGSPAEAMRETIEALQPAISQAIMSQPGMSARSMDSERELQFFIRSITAPTADVWANYATLHALDNRFGSGQLMNSLLQSGEITQADYDKITRSPRVAAITGAMNAKINELFTLEQGIADTITPEEAAELEELRRWKKDRGIP